MLRNNKLRFAVILRSCTRASCLGQSFPTPRSQVDLERLLFFEIKCDYLHLFTVSYFPYIFSSKCLANKFLGCILNIYAIANF